jgi:hypothetical protein
MSVEKSGRRDGALARQAEDHSNIPTFSGCGRISRDLMLAGTSLVAIGAIAAPDRALAACSGPNQTISTPTTGPVLGNGGAITVTATGIVTGSGGVTGSDGVDAAVCPETTLANSGAITCGAGSAHRGKAADGTGVANSDAIGSLNNRGAISGGHAGSVSGNATGGAGVRNSGAITKLINSGAISGGDAGSVSGNATGGAGVRNSGAITNLTNRGAISGGDASSTRGAATQGDAILSAGAKASIGTIANSGSITGKVVIDK